MHKAAGRGEYLPFMLRLMSDAYLIIEDDPGRRLFLEKKLQGAVASGSYATRPSQLILSSRQQRTALSSMSHGSASLSFPFGRSLKAASGELRRLDLIFTGT